MILNNKIYILIIEYKEKELEVKVLIVNKTIINIY